MQKLYSYLFILSVGLFSSACSDDVDPEKVAQREFLKQLSGTWAVNQVEANDIIVTDAFPEMEISFTTKKAITVANPVGNIWPATSSFSLQKVGDSYTLLRDDDITITITELTESLLKFNMSFISAPGGRVASISGNYSFEMIKN